eukprot:TRINITY_DN7447_c0_g1_i1.p1 TRINITY_DN7447_c0_g1~~TRINITY_DN7447_c0_g1_i1.p1  ORF type:complete len:267 (+),score=67.20 TRINITY_DN7447_c0_g1_i1:1-801(+)
MSSINGKIREILSFVQQIDLLIDNCRLHFIKVNQCFDRLLLLENPNNLGLVNYVKGFDRALTLKYCEVIDEADFFISKLSSRLDFNYKKIVFLNNIFNNGIDINSKVGFILPVEIQEKLLDIPNIINHELENFIQFINMIDLKIKQDENIQRIVVLNKERYDLFSFYENLLNSFPKPQSPRKSPKKSPKKEKVFSSTEVHKNSPKNSILPEKEKKKKDSPGSLNDFTKRTQKIKKNTNMTKGNNSNFNSASPSKLEKGGSVFSRKS